MKPGFFQNEQLAELDFGARLLFIGLWCMADREGRLEDRPKRIKMQIFPADLLDVEPLLVGLAEQGLIKRYVANGIACIWIPEFLKHQRPHSKEQPSELPMFHVLPKAPTQDGVSTDLGSGEHALNPDSPSLIPESSPYGRERASATRLAEDFELTPERRAVAEAEKLPADRTFAKFRDYWLAASGAKARKHDWDATWRNWCRTEADRSRGTAPKTPWRPPAEDPAEKERAQYLALAKDFSMEQEPTEEWAAFVARVKARNERRLRALG